MTSNWKTKSAAQTAVAPKTAMAETARHRMIQLPDSSGNVCGVAPAILGWDLVVKLALISGLWLSGNPHAMAQSVVVDECEKQIVKALDVQRQLIDRRKSVVIIRQILKNNLENLFCDHLNFKSILLRPEIDSVILDRSGIIVFNGVYKGWNTGFGFILNLKTMRLEDTRFMFGE